MTDQQASAGQASAGEQEFLSFGWSQVSVTVPGGDAATPQPGYAKGDFAVVGHDDSWTVIAQSAGLVLGTLPSASAVRRFVTKCVSFPAQPNGAIIGAARQAMLQAVEEELHLARQSADLLEAKIADLMGSIDDIQAKSILFTKGDDED